MKQYVIYVLTFLGIVLGSCTGDDVITENNDIDSSNDPTGMYVAGYTLDDVYQPHAFVKKNGINLTLNTNSEFSRAYAVIVDGNDVYVAGETFESTNFITTATLWKNGNIFWISEDENSSATDVEVVSGNIYISGTTEEGVVYWKNGVKNVMPNSSHSNFGSNSAIPKIEVSNEIVYVSGVSHNGNNTNAAYWKNGVINTLTEMTYGIANATDIKVVGNDVYVSGYKGNFGEFSDALYWKNGVAVNIPNSYSATGIDVDNGNVYVVGLDKHLVDFGGGTIDYDLDTTLWNNGAPISYEEYFLDSPDIDVLNNNTFIVGSRGSTLSFANIINGVYTEDAEERSHAMSVFVK